MSAYRAYLTNQLMWHIENGSNISIRQHAKENYKRLVSKSASKVSQICQGQRSIRFLCGYNCNRKPSDLFPVTLIFRIYTTVDFSLALELRIKSNALSVPCFRHLYRFLSENFVQQFWCNIPAASPSFGKSIKRTNSSAGIMTRLPAGRSRSQEFDSQHRQDIFSSPKRPYWPWGPPSLLFNRHWE
jgi:hypothetical protein